ncbi:hypothetical protein EJ05DRAFT_489122 [Pseudovirgaria hyperparasitica]|uniref:Uncharacterized protein n=1 Tax=Pseudovirgaria hyperparasitica TaxID=470096 RepID=A0A6A6W011_9PEZI|nr:uncharacterized protein EJ05DRAFT_489122 [Pseudovirgaria hyperparasitica]KAF2754401.1 hypothetical protein EJ05DRAFT_489122 [Pseudovirgaria hyperparasitica]
MHHSLRSMRQYLVLEFDLNSSPSPPSSEIFHSFALTPERTLNCVYPHTQAFNLETHSSMPPPRPKTARSCVYKYLLYGLILPHILSFISTALLVWGPLSSPGASHVLIFRGIYTIATHVYSITLVLYAYKSEHGSGAGTKEICPWCQKQKRWTIHDLKEEDEDRKDDDDGDFVGCSDSMDEMQERYDALEARYERCRQMLVDAQKLNDRYRMAGFRPGVIG